MAFLFTLLSNNGMLCTQSIKTDYFDDVSRSIYDIYIKFLMQYKMKKSHVLLKIFMNYHMKPEGV